MKKNNTTRFVNSPWNAFMVLMLVLVMMPATTWGGNDHETGIHEHDKQGETCFICDASLRDKGRLWCKGHDRYEDRCWLCHPELEDKGQMWCKEHSLYEDECFLCHPELLNADEDTVASESKTVQTNPTVAPAKCSVHGVNKELCYICDTTQREKGRLWCQGHDRYEDRCWLCQPDLEDKDRPFCDEHGLYEDECYFCNPDSLADADSQQASKPSNQPVLFCKEHDVPEHQCGICQPQLAVDLQPGESMKVRFASAMSTTKAGIKTAIPIEGLSTPSIPTYFEVGYNENELALITPLTSGVIKKIHYDVGRQVKPGDVLVEIHSTEIAEAKTNFLSTIIDKRMKSAALNREKALIEQNISAKRDFIEAQAADELAALKSKIARQRLKDFGFSDAEIALIEEKQDSSSLATIRAPFEGTLVARNAVIGESVKAGKALFSLANLESMWLELSISPNDLAFVQEGAAIEATFDGLPGIVIKGVVSWVDTSIDMRSRMFKARAIVPNFDKQVKKGMFGQASIVTAPREDALLVPIDSIQRYEKVPFVFIEESDDLYQLRRVSLGKTINSNVEITRGIGPNDRVVVVGSFTVMSEYLKSRLGAGCVDD